MVAATGETLIHDPQTQDEDPVIIMTDQTPTERHPIGRHTGWCDPVTHRRLEREAFPGETVGCAGAELTAFTDGSQDPRDAVAGQWLQDSTGSDPYFEVTWRFHRWRLGSADLDGLRDLLLCTNLRGIDDLISLAVDALEQRAA